MRVHHFAREGLFPFLAGPESAYDSHRIRWIPYVRHTQYFLRNGLKEEIPCHFCSAD
jgi:hypothetical protein